MTTATEEKTTVRVGFDLLAEMAKVDPSTQVDYSPLGEGEVVVGQATENIVRMGLVRKAVFEQALPHRRKIEDLRKKHALAHIMSAHNELDCLAHHKLVEEVLEEHGDILRRFEQIDEIFWNTVRLEFPEIGEDNPGIREGGKIVRIKDEKEEASRLDMMSGLALLSILGEDLGRRKPKTKES